MLRDSLLTRNEQKFYAALQNAVQDDWDVFAMVRLADLIRVEPEAEKRQAWQNRINCKHVDFVLCDHYNLQPVLAIEVDDRSHQRADRRRRDEFLNDALERAQLPLLRVPAASDYEPIEVRESIDLLVSAASTPRFSKRRKTAAPTSDSRRRTRSR